jgi:hypothetical protein
MAEPVEIQLKLTMAAGRLMDFSALLQQGFGVQARTGCSLQELLCSQWGIDPGYVASRITTIFLNSRATDDIATAIVRNGSVIALSGAMPGLVGATMRRGGYYSAMRGAMTYHDDSPDSAQQTSEVKVKLFNLLLPELGPSFLRRGIILTGEQLGAFFRDRGTEFWSGCLLIRKDSDIISSDDVAAICEHQGRSGKICLSVQLEE